MTRYGLTLAQLDLLQAAMVLPLHARLDFLAERTECRLDVVALLASFIEIANSVEENALSAMRVMLVAEGRMSERASEQVNIPSLMGAFAGAARAVDPVPGMCSSCAFRLGTIPNQCLVTIFDSVYAAENCANFMCHDEVDEDMEPIVKCVGFSVAEAAARKVAA